MKRIRTIARTGVCVGLVFCIEIQLAIGHGIVGKRMFIEPLFTEDANVKNEMVLPSAEFLVQPDGTWRTLGFSIEKELSAHRLSVVFGENRVYQHASSGKLAGWDNIELGLKWESFVNETHELILSPALFMSFPTSSAKVVPQETSLHPMITYGKGLGDLSVGWLRPFAVQGDFGYEASLRGERRRQVNFDEVLFYSIPFLNRWVRHIDKGYTFEHDLRQGFSRGALLGNLFPYVEFNALNGVDGTQSGISSTLRPGILWMGKFVQVSVAADLPIQGPAVARRHAGVAVSIDWFLDEILPRMSWTPFGRGHSHHP